MDPTRSLLGCQRSATAPRRAEPAVGAVRYGVCDSEGLVHLGLQTSPTRQAEVAYRARQFVQASRQSV